MWRIILTQVLWCFIWGTSSSGWCTVISTHWILSKDINASQKTLSSVLILGHFWIDMPYRLIVEPFINISWSNITGQLNNLADGIRRYKRYRYQTYGNASSINTICSIKYQTVYQHILVNTRLLSCQYQFENSAWFCDGITNIPLLEHISCAVLVLKTVYIFHISFKEGRKFTHSVGDMLSQSSEWPVNLLHRTKQNNKIKVSAW